MKIFNTKGWYRENQFEFFKDYEDPFFNITTQIDVTNLRNYCKKHQKSFSLGCIFIVIKAINSIEEYRLRFHKGAVVSFDKVNVGSTVLNENNSFSFCDFQFMNDFNEFVDAAQKVIDNYDQHRMHETELNPLAMVHCTTIPWVEITGFKHARKGDEKEQGIPKIVFGKRVEEGGKFKISFSIEQHHALVDGLHVGLLVQKMETIIKAL